MSLAARAWAWVKEGGWRWLLLPLVALAVVLGGVVAVRKLFGPSEPAGQAERLAAAREEGRAAVLTQEAQEGRQAAQELAHAAEAAQVDLAASRAAEAALEAQRAPIEAQADARKAEAAAHDADEVADAFNRPRP